jgi:hypothetical protein
VNAFAMLDALEVPSEPIFPVELPNDDPRAELPRQVEFLRDLKMLAPSVYAYAVPNAGKRNPRQAKAEGIVGGVFDLELRWNSGAAQVEFKGRDARGRPGKLSPAQIDHGNRMTGLGWPVACFFDPQAALEWVRSLGAPFRDRAGL